MPSKFTLLSLTLSFIFIVMETVYAQNSLLPKKLAIYYGYPSLVNGSKGNLKAAIEVFNDYDLMVFGDELQDSGHPDHTNTATIISHLKTSPNNTAVYGYIPLGTGLPMSEIQTRVDAWKAMGVKGIFLDLAGYDFGVSRQRQNDAVDYIHSQQLSLFINAWNPDDVFSSAVEPIYNPTGAPTHLNNNDIYLHESFQIQLNDYQDETFWISKSDRALSYKNQYGTRMATITTVSEKDPGFDQFGQEKFDYAWYSTLLYGFDAMGWGESIFSAWSHNLPYRGRPDPGEIGNAFTSAVIHKPPMHTRTTTTGMIEVNTQTRIRKFTHDAVKDANMEWIQIAKDGKGFVLEPSGRQFILWGFNYDHDEKFRLLEDYWESEWAKVEEDFSEMKELGANIVRIHLQLGRFMQTPNQPNEKALEQLQRLIALAERLKLYLDLTGLSCYRKEDIPSWYDALSEQERWGIQAHFWEEIASRCSKNLAVFCYTLMNEPVSPGESQKNWLFPPFDDGYHYVEFITKEPGKRSRLQVTREWVAMLTKAIRKHDPKHLITVGLFPIIGWNPSSLNLGDNLKALAANLDFLSVHVYPEAGKVEEAIAFLKVLNVGKPVLVQETFPLRCALPEFRQFILGSKSFASGWLGFYWGKKAEEYRRSEQIADALMLGWLELFREEAEAIGR